MMSPSQVAVASMGYNGKDGTHEATWGREVAEVGVIGVGPGSSVSGSRKLKVDCNACLGLIAVLQNVPECIAQVWDCT